jgi:hypothetical protein
MNAARIFLNGTDYTPDVISDLNDLGEHIWYDTERKAFLQEITGTITLGGQGFRYFQNLLRTNYDTQVPCTLSRFDDYAGAWQTVLHGLVFVTDCKFDLYAQTVEVQLVDNSYFAKIENNKGIKFVIGSGRSKNGVNITGVATSTQIKVLNNLPTPPLTYLPNTVTGWSRYEAMKFLVAAMTDNEVGFYSDFLQDYLDPVQNVLNNGFLFSGEALRAGTEQYGPNISFDYCYNDLAKLYNLVQYIERDSNGNLRLRVEKFDDIRQSNVILTEHVDTGVAEMINSDTLYSTVVLGSKEQDLDGYFTFTPFLSTFQEQYAMSYRSNVNKELDLQMQAFITDSNLIYYTQTQQGLTDPDSGNDDKVFYVVCRRYNGIDWDEKASLSFSNEYYLNEDISNTNVLLNNFTGLPATIFKQYVSLFLTGFYANSTGPYVQQPSLAGTPFQFDLLYPIFFSDGTGQNWNDTMGGGVFGTPPVPSNEFYCQWDNDSVAPAFDAGGNYSTTAFIYTVPIAGVYKFYALFDMLVEQILENPVPPIDDFGNQGYELGLDFSIILRITDATDTTSTVWTEWKLQNGFYDSLGNYINIGSLYTQQTYESFIFDTNTPINLVNPNTPRVLNVGDKISLTIKASWNQFNNFPLQYCKVYIRQPSHFTLEFTNVEGGNLVQVQDGNNYLLKNEWTGNVPLPNWQQILAAPFSKLRYQVNDAGEQRNMWVLDMTRKILSGVTDAQLTGRLVDEVPPNFESNGGGEGPEEGG